MNAKDAHPIAGGVVEEATGGRRPAGRPLIDRTRRTQVTFYIDLETMEELARAAEAAKVTRSEWVVRAIRERLAREREAGGSPSGEGRGT